MNIFRLMGNEAKRKPLSSVLIFCLSFLCALALAAVVVCAHNGKRWSLDLLGLGDEALQLTVIPATAHHIFGIGISKPRFSEDDFTWLHADPDVAAIHKIHAVPIPATIHIKIPHIADNTQVVTLIGLDSDVFSSTDDQDIRERWHVEADALAKKSVIPIVINPAIIRYYNLGMADRYGLPRIDHAFVLGLTFDMRWGADLFKREPNAFYSKVTVVGLSTVVSPWDVGIPHDYAEQLIGTFFKDQRPASASAMKLRVIAKSADTLEALKQRIHNRKLRIPENNPLIAIIHKTHQASGYIISGLMFIVASIVLLSLSSIISMICSERKRQIALYRQLGASLPQLIFIFLGGISCSLYAGVLSACLLVRFCAEPLLAPFLQQCELATQVQIPASLELSALGIAFLLCLASSSVLWRIKRMDMLILLREE